MADRPEYIGYYEGKIYSTLSAQELYTKMLNENIPFHRVESTPLTPTGERYNSIAKVEPSLRHVQDLLYHRMHTARKILEHNTNNPMRDMFVKYLEMIENEIKKALILE